MTSNVPLPQFTPVGVSQPSESDIKAGLWADFQAAFGGKLNQSDATPQGQLVTALTALIGANNDLFLEYVNSVDPALASGRMQDAIGRIYYMSRIAATPTTVTCLLTGASGTIIDAGALAQASDGTIYQSNATVTIGLDGTVTAQFTATTPGPILCPANSVNTIYRVVPGWDSITNPTDGLPGRNAETRAQFEDRRSVSVAANSAGMLQSILGSVLNVEGVSDAFVTENTSASPTVIGGITIPAKSVYVAAQGGADEDVARAIWTRKPPGCGYAGSTMITITDTSSGYEPPYPTYVVNFQRPVSLPIYFAVSIANNGQVPSDAPAQIKAAIVAAFGGADGGPRARIASTIYALRFVSAIQALGDWAQVLTLAIGTTSSPSAASVTSQINQVPTINPANISVTLV